MVQKPQALCSAFCDLQDLVGMQTMIEMKGSLVCDITLYIIVSVLCCYNAQIVGVC